MPGTFAVEALGVGAALTEFSRWGWAFRPQPVPDFGIDAHVEPFDGDTPSGKPIALQIKAGASYFGEPVQGGWVYRGPDRHLRYWLRHTLPVVLLLHDPDAGVTYWAHVTPAAVEYTDAGWKMLVPAVSTLGPESTDALRVLAESALGASDDPLELSCAVLPPVTAKILRSVEPTHPVGALRLAAWLARGRADPRLAAGSVLSSAPSWLPDAAGAFEVALATYVGEHGHPDMAAQAYAQAASYSDPSRTTWLVYAVLSAAEAGAAEHARTLMERVPDDTGAPLLLAVARAVVGHLEEPGPAPVPDLLMRASPAALAAEPTCLAFLGAQALYRQDGNTAVRYFEEGCAAMPDSTSLRLQLAQALQARVVSGQSAVEAEDLRRMEEAARAALEQRRRWSGPSGAALGMLIRRHMLAGAFETAVCLATAEPGGEATVSEATCDDVVILGTQAALIAGDRDRAREISGRAESDHARSVVRALMADPDLPPAEQAGLWHAVLAHDGHPHSQLLAAHRMACLGVWPLPGLGELRAAGIIDDMYRDLLDARAMAASGQLVAAVSILRGYASRSPTAAEILVDVLEAAGRFDEALDEAARGFSHFGESILAHKRLNLLVLADRPDEAAAEAHRFLARADTPPELRLRTRRRLIAHYVHRADWAGVEEQSRATLGEFPGLADIQWQLIAATANQGRLARAYGLINEFSPEITQIPQAGLWLSLHVHYGFSPGDVTASLDLLDRWKDDTSFAGQVLACLLTAENMHRPDGNPILPELEPQTLYRLQSSLASYTAANHDGPIRALSASPREIVDMLRLQLAPMAERDQVIMKYVRQGRVSLGALAAVRGGSYAQALVQRACGMLLAVTPDPGPFAREIAAAQAALDGAVVIETSAIVVATTLPDRWPQLRGAFTELKMTRDAWNDVHAARERLLREPGTIFSVGYDRGTQALLGLDLTSEEYHHYIQRFNDVYRALPDLALIDAPELGALADYTHGSEDPAVSPLAAAARIGAAVWSDDAALRALAGEQAIPAFGTLALLHVLIEAERIGDTLRDDVLTLARSYVADFVLTAEELMSLAAENDYLPGPASLILSRPLFWAEPGSARELFMDLIEAVNLHAPATVATWLQAACWGLAIRSPEDTIKGGAAALAAAVTARISASDDVCADLIDAAAKAAEHAAAAWA